MIVQNEGILNDIKRELNAQESDRSEKLLSKFKLGQEVIEWEKLKKHISRIYGDTIVNGFNFLRLLLGVTSKTTNEVSKSNVKRVFNVWLKTAGPEWIGKKYKDTYFIKYYMGEKKEKDIEKDDTMWDKNLYKPQAMLFWDIEKEIFCAIVRYSEKKNPTKSKKIIEKFSSKELIKLETELPKMEDKIRYTGKIHWVKSPLFNSLLKSDPIEHNHMYSTASLHGGPSKESIYVY